MGGPTNEWQRTPLDVSVEVPLTGHALESDARPDASPEPNWRRSIGVAVAGGVLVGIVMSVVILNGDDSTADDGTATTLAADVLSSRMTTPPTLSPLTPLPPPDDPALAEFEEGPQPTTSQERTLFDPLPTPPQYPDVVVMTGDDRAELAEYDLADAVTRLGDDVARRSTTHLELGTGGYVLDVTITRDPERDRYQIVLETRGDTQVAVVDNASGTTYLNIGTDGRREVPNSEIIAGSDAETVNEYFDRLLLGPLRPDTIDAAEIDDRSLVTIADVGVARQFDATISGSLVPEWQLFAFSPVFEFPVEDRPSALDYSVYVDQSGEVVQVDGVSLVGNVPQLVQHRIEVLEPPDPIEIIDENGAVTDDTLDPATTTPITAP